jgi:hypothetical protein
MLSTDQMRFAYVRALVDVTNRVGVDVRAIRHVAPGLAIDSIATRHVAPGLAIDSIATRHVAPRDSLGAGEPRVPLDTQVAPAAVPRRPRPTQGQAGRLLHLRRDRGPPPALFAPGLGVTRSTSAPRPGLAPFLPGQAAHPKRLFAFRTAATSLRAAVPRSPQLLLNMPDNGGKVESRTQLVETMAEWVGKRV